MVDTVVDQWVSGQVAPLQNSGTNTQQDVGLNRSVQKYVTSLNDIQRRMTAPSQEEVPDAPFADNTVDESCTCKPPPPCPPDPVNIPQATQTVTVLLTSTTTVTLPSLSPVVAISTITDMATTTVKVVPTSSSTSATATSTTPRPTPTPTPTPVLRTYTTETMSHWTTTVVNTYVGAVSTIVNTRSKFVTAVVIETIAA